MQELFDVGSAKLVSTNLKQAKKCPGIKLGLIRCYRASTPHSEAVASPFPVVESRIKIDRQWKIDCAH
jgi:hypothetical protein